MRVTSQDAEVAVTTNPVLQKAYARFHAEDRRLMIEMCQFAYLLGAADALTFANTPLATDRGGL